MEKEKDVVDKALCVIGGLAAIWVLFKVLATIFSFIIVFFILWYQSGQ